MEAWDNFLSQLDGELGVETVDKWLRSLRVLRFDAGNIHLTAKDSFQALWFEEHVRPKIQNRLQNNNGKNIRVHLAVGTQDTPPPLTGRKNSKPVSAPNSNSAPSFSLTFDDLDPSCCFSSLVVGPANELAAKLLIDLSSSLNQLTTPDAYSFNPVYIHGSKGSGKTHLMMATAEALRKRNLNVAYCRAETFTEHVISAIRAGEMSVFRNAYRYIDVLMVDDVQTFGRKAATQEEFFHTFNTLHLAGKQIILSANCAPPGLQSIEPRLVSRFEWGIVLPLELQTREELLAMLEQKAVTLNYKLAPRLATFLVDTFKSGSKSLMKALHALILRSHMNFNEGMLITPIPTVQQAKEMLKDLISAEEIVTLTPEKILLHISEYFGIRPEDILKKAQSRDSVLPRQIAMYFCRNDLKMPFTKIGAYFTKDHSTVMSSVKLIEAALKNQVEEITSPVYSIKRVIENYD